MATENRGVMVYLSTDLENMLVQYCLERNITRKSKNGHLYPSLGTGIVQYLKSQLLGAVPSQIPTSPSSNILTREEVLDLIEHSNSNSLSSNGLTKNEVVEIFNDEIKKVLESLTEDSSTEIDEAANQKISKIKSLIEDHRVNNKPTRISTLIWKLGKIINSEEEKVGESQHTITPVNTEAKVIEESQHIITSVNTELEVIVETPNISPTVPIDLDAALNKTTVITDKIAPIWMDATTLSVQLSVTKAAISAAIKKGSDLGDGMVAFVLNGVNIHRRGRGVTAEYQVQSSC